jgi:hypothetical protein
MPRRKEPGPGAAARQTKKAVGKIASRTDGRENSIKDGRENSINDREEKCLDGQNQGPALPHARPRKPWGK